VGLDAPEILIVKEFAKQIPKVEWGTVMKNENKVVIYRVLPGSIAHEAGLQVGDILLSINDQVVEDIFDYRFLISDEELILEVQKDDGEIWEVEIEKDEYEDLGIEFEDDLIDEAKSCTNKCIFCFIDQLPKGMRDTLYFKDDDSRLSFLTGNYVTLTNMKDNDIDRIIRYRMTPINVSVHTTNPDLRFFMLKNKFAGNVMSKIKKLTESGITVNCQIVLCRGINDESELINSLNDLSELYPGVMSVSVVPVGLTKYREGLCELIPYDKDSSFKVIEQVEKIQEELLKKHESRIVYLADEFYIMAEKDLPDYEHYEDFPQIENGVGLVALLIKEFEDCIKNEVLKPVLGRKVSIATGFSAYSYIARLAKILADMYKIKVNVYKIKNNYFGENVTVTGLLTGVDIKNQLKGKDLGDELIICKSMLKANTELFLDDYTVERLEKELQIKIRPVENSGADFVKSILY